MTVRAKVHCSKFVNSDGSTQLNFYGVCSQDPNSENKAFSDATPSLNVSMGIAAGKPAADAFESGKCYYMDFTEAPAS